MEAVLNNTMEITLYENKTEKVETTIVAVLEFGRLTISGVDHYLPTELVPEPSDYMYETLLDSYATEEFLACFAPDLSEEAVLAKLKEEFGGEQADIKFQSYCLENDIELNHSSFFED